jgi:3-deoxy-manno-octulosonate cytidylyltransferase (CMP-KDO synthetase)
MILGFYPMTVLAVIPARFQSSRFPGKMLANILGKSLIQRTYESSKECLLIDKLIVATDDERIFDHVKSFGGDVVMTSIDCLNGTYRIVDALKRYPELTQYNIVVNIQGDRPCIPAQSIEEVVKALKSNPHDVMATPVVRIEDPEEVQNPASVKCVLDKNGYALYFSRSPIPHTKTQAPYYKHIGLYAYTKDFLLEYAELHDTPLQLNEDLEQLKVLEHGYRIKTVEIKEVDLSVDYLEDITKVEKYLCSLSLSS